MENMAAISHLPHWLPWLPWLICTLSNDSKRPSSESAMEIPSKHQKLPICVHTNIYIYIYILKYPYTLKFPLIKKNKHTRARNSHVATVCRPASNCLGKVALAKTLLAQEIRPELSWVMTLPATSWALVVGAWCITSSMAWGIWHEMIRQLALLPRILAS